MYLSKIVLNPYSKEARRDLASPYQMHATLSRAFANEDKKPPRFLWRQENSKGNLAPTVLVQSNSKADWYKLVKSKAFPNYFREEPVQSVLPIEQLQLGQVLRFRLKANPTVTRQGKRIGLYKYEELIGKRVDNDWQPGWLERQAVKNGFELVTVVLKNTKRVRFSKHRTGPIITLQAALFEGNLTITDLDLFINALGKGIGKAKALGFGLLSVAKS